MWSRICILLAVLLGIGIVLSACSSLPALSHQQQPCQSGNIPVVTPSLAVHIYGEVCDPPSGATNTVMVLVPGLTYTHAYWDWPSMDGITYSAVRYLSALDGRQGTAYSTFTYDRVGTGQSSHPPSRAIDLQSNVEILHQLIQRLYAGTIGLGTAFPFSHVVLIGHSFGSIIAENEAATYHDEQAVILTGSLHKTNKAIAKLSKTIPARNDPSQRFAQLDPGYLTRPASSIGPLFFANIGIASDPAVIAYNEKILSTETVSELQDDRVATRSFISRGITVPVLLIVGQQDAIHCVNAVDCRSAASVHQEEAPFFAPQARLQVDLILNTGHDLNLHVTCFSEYAAIVQWLVSFHFER